MNGRTLSTPPQGSRLVSQIVISFALPEEAGGLLDRMEQIRSVRCAHFVEHTGRLAKHDLVVLTTGVGPELATSAAKAALELYRPIWWIASGFAGGLVPDLPPEQIVLADRLHDLESAVTLDLSLPPSTDNLAEQSPCSTAGSTAIPLPTASAAKRIGSIVSVPKLLTKPALKRQLGQEIGAMACDMETFAIARQCQTRGAKIICARIISDAVDEEIPDIAATIARHETWAGRLGAAAGAIWRRPASGKELWALRERAIVCSDRLARYLEQLVSQLEPTTQNDRKRPKVAEGFLATNRSPPGVTESRPATPSKSKSPHSQDR